MKTVFNKKAFTGLAFSAMLATGALLATPSAHAQFFPGPGLSANAMSSVGGHSVAAGNFSASVTGARSNGYASFGSFGGLGGYETNVTAGSSSDGFSRSMGHAASGFDAFGNGNAYGF